MAYEEEAKPPSAKRALATTATASKRSKAKRAAESDDSSAAAPDDDDDEDDKGGTSGNGTAVSTAGNGYDTLLSESEDLLQAAAEAQHLGRLRMSYSYLRLLHGRLVGLGKRFDKAISSQGKSAKVTRELSDLMPHVQFDSQMMEHLAKAAEELHKARCGIPADGSAASTAASTDLRAMFASQLRSRLVDEVVGSPHRKQQQQQQQPAPPVPEPPPVVLPNCNARQLLAGCHSYSSSSEDEGGGDDGDDDGSNAADRNSAAVVPDAAVDQEGVGDDDYSASQEQAV